MPTVARAKKGPTKRPSKTAKKSSPKGGISDAAVEKATGRTPGQWFTILDAFAKKQGEHVHKDAAAHLHEQHGCPEWWCQMVTVHYERDRGLRKVHERPDGYSISVSRTVGVPISMLYAAWNARSRAKWLPEEFTVRKATEDRSIRITWGDGTNVEVMFYPKGEGKAQVSVQHSKLKNDAAGKKMKAFWAARLDALSALVAG
jgi:hypothetical protein